MEGKPTVATLAVQIDDHLKDCVEERKRTNKSLEKIWGVLLAVAASAFLQLLGVAGFLFVKAYG